MEDVSGTRDRDVESEVQPLDVKARIIKAIKRPEKEGFRNIDVTVKDGSVRLEGRVSSLEDFKTASRAAWGTQGVRNVENNIVIMETAKPKAIKKP